MKKSTRQSVMAILLVLGLALSACGSDTDEKANNVAATPEADEEQVVEADPKTCLHGTWRADNEFFLASMREFGDEPTSVEGEVTVTFGADGSISTKYAGWRITMNVDGREAVMTREGTDKGTYSTEAGAITIQEDKVESVLNMKTAGMTMTVPSAPVDYSDAKYTCAATDAKITTPDGTAVLTRISD